MMRLGIKALEALKTEVSGCFHTDDDILMVGAAGLEGTGMLAENEEVFLRQYFSNDFLWQSRRNCIQCGITIRGVDTSGFHVFMPLGEGGVLAALWKMAEVSQSGIRVNLRMIPICQETVEICERFSIDPYKLLSGGAFLAGCKNGSLAAEEWKKKGILSVVIGKACSGNDRLLFSGEITRFLDRPARDEIFRFPWYQHESY